MLERVFRNIDDGFYIDVGAAHPVFRSVTMHFYQRGWQGVNVEPVLDYHLLLTKHRVRDINLHLALGKNEGRFPFFEVEDCPELSTLCKDYGETYSERLDTVLQKEVNVTTLEKVCHEHAHKEIHFLKIDVEGAQLDVIEGGDWSTFRPSIVLIEATKPNTPDPDWSHWEPQLLSYGHNFVYFDGVNRFYVKEETMGLAKHFSVPPNVFDNFQIHSPEADMLVNSLKQELHKVQHSRSWQYTRPLRTLRRCFGALISKL